MQELTMEELIALINSQKGRGEKAICPTGTGRR